MFDVALVLCFVLLCLVAFACHFTSKQKKLDEIHECMEGKGRKVGKKGVAYYTYAAA